MFWNVAFDNKVEGSVQYKIKEIFFNKFCYKLNEKKKKKEKKNSQNGDLNFQVNSFLKYLKHTPPGKSF